MLTKAEDKNDCWYAHHWQPWRTNFIDGIAEYYRECYRCQEFQVKPK